MFTIRKLFTFETAHALDTSYSEECCNIHGHSYKLEIKLSAFDLNEDGMVIDFKLLKEIVTKHIIDRLDHKLVLPVHAKQKEPIAFSFIAYPEETIEWVPYNPTAENMVNDIYQVLYPILINEFPKIIALVVRLHETDTGWAEFSGGPL